MKKRIIIPILILIGFVGIIVFLNNVVFSLSKVNLYYSADFAYAGKDIEIIDNTNFKKGKCVLFIDKEKATNNLEKQFPYLKVDKIKISSRNTVSIKLSNRQATYYAKYLDNYYVLDSALKVLEIQKDKPVCIELENVASISSSVKAGDFLNDNTFSPIFEELYENIYNYAKIGEDYLSNQEICDLIPKITVETKTVDEHDDYTIVLHTDNTKYGVCISISAPQTLLEDKVKNALSLFNQMVKNDMENGTNYTKIGEIRVDNIDGNVVVNYTTSNV